MRNDGVDIYLCNDKITNQYYVGKTEKGEWIQYTINSKADKSYAFDIRYASSGEAKIRIEDASGNQLSSISLPSTGGQSQWKTVSAKGLNLKKGENKIRIAFENNGVDINYFELK
jgi:hypothetical protein